MPAILKTILVTVAVIAAYNVAKTRFLSVLP